MLVLVASVAWMLARRPRAAPEVPTAATPAEKPQTVMQELVHRVFVDGREDLEVRAERMREADAGRFQLEVVQANFPYVSEGQEVRGNIAADECLYVPAQQQAFFKGNVRLRTEDGFELDTDALTWRGAEGRAQTGRPVAFRRGPLSGHATGMTYSAQESRIVLPADVSLHIEREGEAPVDVESASAVLDERSGELVFDDHVRVTQQDDELLSEQLTLYGWRGGVDRARAVRDVRLTLGPGSAASPGSGPLVSRGGPRHLEAHQLDLDFQEGQLRVAAASGPAELEILPGPGEPPERRSIRAQVLIFLFDAQGRVTEVQTQRRRLERTTVRIESLADATQPPRILSCFGLVARFDPETGAAQSAGFRGDVVFEQGARRATAQRADYAGDTGVLTLSEQPRLVDTEQQSQLEARQIDIHAGSADASARHDVRHTLERGLRRAGGGVVGEEGEPVVFSARLFEWDALKRAASYRGTPEGPPALMRSGRDEIRAPLIVVRDDPGGDSSLVASGGITSLLHTSPEEPGGPVTAIDGSAESMTYEEASESVVYEGGVRLAQGAIITRSPVATLKLAAGGGRIESLVAGEPVEIVEGERKVNGDRAVYTPETETVVVEGERVVFTDPGRQIEGRRLEFKVADETLQVGSEQQTRTRTVFLNGRREP